VYARIKEMGKFLETKRTEGISTSEMIIRIIAEYDTFIRRNLQRGYTGKEMNVPFMKEQSIKFDMAVDKVKHDVDSLVHKWMEKAEDMQHGFLDLFSKEGRLVRLRYGVGCLVVAYNLMAIGIETAHDFPQAPKDYQGAPLGAFVGSCP
jgi:hypothetical protein